MSHSFEDLEICYSRVSVHQFDRVVVGDQFILPTMNDQCRALHILHFIEIPEPLFDQSPNPLKTAILNYVAKAREWT